MTWKARAGALLLGIVGGLVALIEANKGPSYTPQVTFWCIVGGVVLCLVLLQVVRHKVARGWRPSAVIGTAAAGSIGGIFGLLLAFFGPPAVACPIVGLFSGVFLAAGCSPTIRDPAEARD
jgi:peptidoglycan/LPS O-acetylase OafA/YrhL